MEFNAKVVLNNYKTKLRVLENILSSFDISGVDLDNPMLQSYVINISEIKQCIMNRDVVYPLIINMIEDGKTFEEISTAVKDVVGADNESLERKGDSDIYEPMEHVPFELWRNNENDSIPIRLVNSISIIWDRVTERDYRINDYLLKQNPEFFKKPTALYALFRAQLNVYIAELEDITQTVTYFDEVGVEEISHHYFYRTKDLLKLLTTLDSMFDGADQRAIGYSSERIYFLSLFLDILAEPKVTDKIVSTTRSQVYEKPSYLTRTEKITWLIHQIGVECSIPIKPEELEGLSPLAKFFYVIGEKVKSIKSHLYGDLIKSTAACVKENAEILVSYAAYKAGKFPKFKKLEGDRFELLDHFIGFYTPNALSIAQYINYIGIAKDEQDKRRYLTQDEKNSIWKELTDEMGPIAETIENAIEAND